VSVPLVATLVLGGIAALDATPVAQTMLSQPLVTATLLGWIWGDFDVAIRVGIVLQILAASTQPVGARTPEDYAVGGVVGAGTALALASHQGFSMVRDGCVMVGVLVALVAAIVGMPIVKWQRRFNEGLSRWCEEQLQNGVEGALGAAQRAAVVLAFSIGVGYTAICMGVGVWSLSDWVRHESLRLAYAWSVAQPVWIGLGLAVVLNGFVQRRITRAALSGISLVAGWLVFMLGGP